MLYFILILFSLFFFLFSFLPCFLLFQDVYQLFETDGLYGLKRASPVTNDYLMTRKLPQTSSPNSNAGPNQRGAQGIFLDEFFFFLYFFNVFMHDFIHSLIISTYTSQRAAMKPFTQKNTILSFSRFFFTSTQKN